MLIQNLKYELSMVFLLARLLSIPAYRQAGIKRLLRRTLLRLVRYSAFGKFKSPSSAWGLTGAKITP